MCVIYLLHSAMATNSLLYYGQQPVPSPQVCLELAVTPCDWCLQLHLLHVQHSLEADRCGIQCKPPISKHQHQLTFSFVPLCLILLFDLAAAICPFSLVLSLLFGGPIVY